MIETLARYKDKGVEIWKNQSRMTKGVILSILAAFILVIFLVIIESRPHFVPLYSNLSADETGQIKETLDAENVPSEISDNGTTISVPKNQVDNLKVELAAKGIPKSGHIDYSFFGQNAQWGMTDKEFGVLKQEAMQTELSRLVSSISGVKNANVMISLPPESMWVSQKDQNASASVVLDLEPGYQLKQEQVQALYHLVSKSIPNLPINNIVIMDQMFNYYELAGGNPASSSFATYEQQRKIKQDIEKDIQQNVQRMLGMMIGEDKVVVSVTTDIDFTKEKSTKDLVKPVDKKSLQGLQVSVEKIRETYTGNGKSAGGTVGTGSSSVPGYVTNSGNGNGTYNHVEQRINNVFNQIHKTIVKSPYTIRDMGIQVIVEPPKPNDPASLPQGTVNNIKNILSTMIRTTLSKSVGQGLTNQQLNNKISISVQPFNGKVHFNQKKTSIIPFWYYIVAGVLLCIIILLIFLLMRKTKPVVEEKYVDVPDTQETVPELQKEADNEETIRRKQLEKMAKDKPEEFAKLLRSWLSEE
ncbi:MAG TPA: flagellar basal-body MS-ring/collar protein FliF [Bacillales bacterium]|nr:flagellar basal-body MS-ring/collar protein FliF [Bacillales bacterium]